MKQGYKTTEFWVLVASAVLKVIFPDLPDELLGLAGAYIVGRAAQKGATSIAKGKENAAETMAAAQVASSGR